MKNEVKNHDMEQKENETKIPPKWYESGCVTAPLYIVDDISGVDYFKDRNIFILYRTVLYFRGHKVAVLNSDKILFDIRMSDENAFDIDLYL